MFNLIHNKKNAVRSHWVIISHYETGKNSKAKQYTFGKAVGKQLLSYTAIENSENGKWFHPVEVNLAISRRLQMHMPFDPRILLLGTDPENAPLITLIFMFIKVIHCRIFL